VKPRRPTSRKPKKDARSRYVLIGTVALVFLAAGYSIYSIVSDDSAPRRRVMEVVQLKVIEPPPPPPPKVEPPPEPPKVVEEQIIEPPIDAPPDDSPPQDEAPPEGPLGLDAQGGGAGDAFGLQGRPGGRDLIGTPRGGGGGGGNRFGRYATLIQSQIDRSLRADEMLEVARFRATMRIWLTPSGTVERVELVRTTGDNDLDQRIAQVISTMPAIPEAPPSEMPQPVIVRIGATPGFG
jgi:TonB family protein